MNKFLNGLIDIFKLILGYQAKRYQNLFKIIRENECRRLMEIGTWNGNNSQKMIHAAMSNFAPNQVDYYGFDLFEDATNLELVEEFSKGMTPSLMDVKYKLEKTGANIFLYKGDTKEVLPRIVISLPIMDFVFIDGGHSIETIENDWNHVQKVMDDNTIVIFDDYYNIDEKGFKKIIENLSKDHYEYDILEPKDKFRKAWGVLEINFVKVQKK